MDHLMSIIPGKKNTDVWSPTIDVTEKDGMMIVHAELPGVKKEDIKIELKDSMKLKMQVVSDIYRNVNYQWRKEK